MAVVTRDALERRQVWCYLAAVLLGLAVGGLWPALGHAGEALVWPVLAGLLYATFTQIPLVSIRDAFRDRRFLSAALVGNFVLVPLLVWALVQFTPDDQVLRLGLLLVLLVPCTDWFITFSQLGRGDATRAVAFTPIALVVQLMLLPLYLWLMAGREVVSAAVSPAVLPAVAVVLVPLGLAALTELWVRRSPGREVVVERLGWWPVPLLSVVIFLIAAGHADEVRRAMHLLPVVAAVCVAYLVGVAVLARLLGTGLGLPVGAARTLTFSMGTRNSFVVLPFALALPAGWEVAAMVIVVQSLVELFGMVFFVWFVPRVLFADPVAV